MARQLTNPAISRNIQLAGEAHLAKIAQKKKTVAHFDVSTRLLDHLGLSAYNSISKSITELVANSYDADARKVRIEIPQSVGLDARVTIGDDGQGMSRKEVETKFLFIGRNKRDEGERSALGRLKIGSKGIGKLAGFGIAGAIDIHTRQNKYETRFTLDRESFEEVTLLSDIDIELVTAKTNKSHGTDIILRELSSEMWLPSAEDLRHHLFRSLPIAPDFSVSVNGIDCSAADIPGKRHEINQRIKNLGSIRGFYVIADKRQPRPGLAVRVRGRVVQEPSLFGINTKEHGYFTAEKIAGEISADFLDPENAGAVDLISTARDGFVEDSPAVQKFDKFVSDFLREIIQGVEKKETQRRADELLKLPAIKKRIDKMPPHIQAVVTKVVRSLIPRLRDDDAETQRLVDWILRYYESNALRELMDAIMASDVKDVQKLSKLVSDWGVRQVREIAELINNQVGIITKLEGMIKNSKAHEIDLHKLIENNLWLIRDGLELWGSDKPLKTLLEGHVKKLYAKKQNLRPDLVCKSQDGGKRAVILEFKRPSEKIDATHITQAVGYKALIEAHRPNITFDLYVVGNTYTPEANAMRVPMEKAEVRFWSYSEILQRARERYEAVLKVLGQA